MSFRNSPWSGRLRAKYVLRGPKSISWPKGYPIAYSDDKDEIFEKLKEHEKEGTPCFVEDEYGERIS